MKGTGDENGTGTAPHQNISCRTRPSGKATAMVPYQEPLGVNTSSANIPPSGVSRWDDGMVVRNSSRSRGGCLRAAAAYFSPLAGSWASDDAIAAAVDRNLGAGGGGEFVGAQSDDRGPDQGAVDRCHPRRAMRVLAPAPSSTVPTGLRQVGLPSPGRRTVGLARRLLFDRFLNPARRVGGPITRPGLTFTRLNFGFTRPGVATGGPLWESSPCGGSYVGERGETQWWNL